MFKCREPYESCISHERLLKNQKSRSISGRKDLLLTMLAGVLSPFRFALLPYIFLDHFSRCEVNTWLAKAHAGVLWNDAKACLQFPYHTSWIWKSKFCPNMGQKLSGLSQTWTLSKIKRRKSTIRVISWKLSLIDYTLFLIRISFFSAKAIILIFLPILG